MSPRLVFGVPLYNSAEHLPAALDSLLAQTLTDVAFVLVDDQSSDATEEIARGYAQRDPRVSYHRNEKRLGLARNWRYAFERATELHPDATLFAWGSDHDIWEPRFAESLVDALIEVPAAALAYPDDDLMFEDRVKVRKPSPDSTGVVGLRRLVNLIVTRVRVGQVVYAVFRVDVLRKAGGFRQVLYADQLVVMEATLQGPMVRVPALLMHKRYTATFSVDRQRRASFPDGVPLWARLPWWVVHSIVLAWNLGVRGSGRPGVGRAKGLAAALLYGYENVAAIVVGRRRKARERRQRLRQKEATRAEKQAARG